MSPARVLWIAAIAAVLYAAFAYWVITNYDIPAIHGWAWALMILAVACQITAKWVFGLLFRESVEEAGSEIKPWSAFKAALVGAGVARLIPAGGAVTPVAMSWTVRDEVDEKRTTGPAIRTTLLNYSGLLILAGVGILIERPRQAIPVFSTSIIVIAPILLVIGLIVMFGSGRLGSISRYLPDFIRKRVEESMVDHLPGWQTQVFVWGRLALEASALYLVMTGFGVEIGVEQALAAFAAGQLVGGLPGMPGGIGVTEGALAVILAAYGFPAASTFAPIIVYRVISYWIPAGLGFLAGGSTFLASDEAKAAAEASS